MTLQSGLALVLNESNDIQACRILIIQLHLEVTKPSPL